MMREYSADELEAQRQADHTYFLTLFRDMLLAHHKQGRDLLGVVRYIDRTIENRERAA